MSFSDAWLTLREPADHRAIDADIFSALDAWARDRVAELGRPLRVLDLGCGTGSNLRATAPRLNVAQHWTLTDHDPALLEAARQRIGDWTAAGNASPEIEYRQAELANADPTKLVANADLVTAAALFDLCSADWTVGLRDAVTGKGGTALFARLSYDGREEWAPPHEADADVLTGFLADQRTDKGFGRAAGPDAWEVIADTSTIVDPVFVTVADTPWQLTAPDDAELIAALADGVADAAARQGVEAGRVTAWRDARRTASRVAIGHRDVLVLPVA